MNAKAPQPAENNPASRVLRSLRSLRFNLGGILPWRRGHSVRVNVMEPVKRPTMTRLMNQPQMKTTGDALLILYPAGGVDVS